MQTIIIVSSESAVGGRAALLASPQLKNGGIEMKAKLVVLATVIAILSLVMAASALADVTVHGLVKQADGATDAGEGIEVTVECDNGDVNTLTDTTDTNSEYQVTFNSFECGNGSSVVASVPGDEESKTVTSENLVLDDLYLVDINLTIPEFSAIAASAAFAGAGIGYLALRRRR